MSDYRVHELVEILDAPMNLISYHLKLLRESGLVAMHQSEADRRDIYYSLEHNVLRQLFSAAGQSLVPSLKAMHLPGSDLESSPTVLFVCTRNSARSQMAEALLREMSKGKVMAFSAGSNPGSIHPDTVSAMRKMQIDISDQQSKHWSVFLGQTFDYVISVCDTAREVCPVFPGSQTIHWSFPDPAAIADSNIRKAAFEQTAEALKSRIRHFLEALQQQTAA
jgi:protein-tyrosine-phosphatase